MPRAMRLNSEIKGLALHWLPSFKHSQTQRRFLFTRFASGLHHVVSKMTGSRLILRSFIFFYLQMIENSSELICFTRNKNNVIDIRQNVCSIKRWVQKDYLKSWEALVGLVEIETARYIILACERLGSKRRALLGCKNSCDESDVLGKSSRIVKGTE